MIMNSKKEQIIEAARTILIREGSSNFSMRKVAAKAAMSLGNLQYYYKTKTDLVESILNSYIASYRIEFDELLQDNKKGRDPLRQLINTALIGEENEADESLFLSLYSLAEQKGMKLIFKNYYGEVITLFGKALETLADFPCSSDSIDRATSLLLSYIEGYAYVSAHIKMDHNEMAGILADTVWNLLKEEG